jgi:hypothetical protein
MFLFYFYFTVNRQVEYESNGGAYPLRQFRGVADGKDVG